MILEETMNQLSHMRLHAMAKALDERLSRSDHKDLSHQAFVGLIVQDEWIDKENKKLNRRLKNAKFKIQACLAEIDYTQKRQGLQKSKIMDLSTLKWIQCHQNILLVGPTGIGKSFIAQAFGHRACEQGHTSHYVRLTKLLNDLFLAKADGSYNNFLYKLSKYDVLIIDDWGIAKLKNEEAQYLLDIIEDRYEIKSTIITTQLPIKHWHEFIMDDTVADAICDRLVHNSIKIEMKGPSMREVMSQKKQSKKEKNLD
ncbi:MAG: IS21-like element helper ATPase IstB [bacterium]|nr:IS21-like element helper ATPase IstB [bacterium]